MIKNFSSSSKKIHKLEKFRSLFVPVITKRARIMLILIKKFFLLIFVIEIYDILNENISLTFFFLIKYSDCFKKKG